jgi:hypothetical protein
MLIRYLRAQSTNICRVQSSVWRLPNIDPPPPLHPASVGGTHSPGGDGVGGQYIGRRQTLDWPLTVIISLRFAPTPPYLPLRSADTDTVPYADTSFFDTTKWFLPYGVRVPGAAPVRRTHCCTLPC